MPLDLPPYLASLATQPPAVQHTWKVGDDMVAMGNETPALLKNVGALSLRAVLGLQAALNEWVAARFQALASDPEFPLVIDAMWAASIDYRYLKLDALDFPRASGPIDGPRRESKMLSENISSMFEEAEFGTVRYVVASANLVRYVLPDSKAFQAWFKAVVQRLPALSQPSAREASAMDSDDVSDALETVDPDVFGTPVPREAFDPAFDLDAADSDALIDALLVRIAAQPNPFLYTAAELTKAGFKGKPYRYPS